MQISLDVDPEWLGDWRWSRLGAGQGWPSALAHVSLI
jgi:hypothetical protein